MLCLRIHVHVHVDSGRSRFHEELDYLRRDISHSRDDGEDDDESEVGMFDAPFFHDHFLQVTRPRLKSYGLTSTTTESPGNT